MSRRPVRVELYEDTAHEWRWRAVAANGKTVADSAEGYVEKRDALGEAWALFGETVTYSTQALEP